MTRAELAILLAALGHVRDQIKHVELAIEDLVDQVEACTDQLDTIEAGLEQMTRDDTPTGNRC